MESTTINKDINAIKELDNKFTNNMRSMIDSLLQSVNKISEINKKYHKLIIKNQIINLQIT